MEIQTPQGIEVLGAVKPGFEHILTVDALKFVGELHQRFDKTRKELLQERLNIQNRISNGEAIQYPTSDHDDNWKVAAIPNDLQCRHVEITGPTERKMVINALNSGSDMFMADLEDSLSPTWNNVIEGQINLLDANKGTITFSNPDAMSHDYFPLCVIHPWLQLLPRDTTMRNMMSHASGLGSVRKLKEKHAMLLVRVRGWHLDEKHITFQGNAIAGALVDFGLYFYHNVSVRLANGTAPYFYLPKMETRFECRLWNNVFHFAEEYLKVPKGTIRATIMVETLLAAVEMEEMLYELKDYAVGMNAGRWDYIFSAIKRLQSKPEAVFPDRKQVTMVVPFMRAYTERLVHVCHKHDAQAMGGMSAFIPSRRDADVNKIAMEKVRQDKEREAADGFDGTWVAHPDLVKLAKDIFMEKLGGRANQVDKKRQDVHVTVDELTTIKVEGGKVTEDGVRVNISVALQYMNCWLQGLGAVAINNLMEDAATAEISRGQLWQWLRHQVTLENGNKFTVELCKRYLAEELEKLGGAGKQQYGKAADVLDRLVFSPYMEEFLTLPAYEILIKPDSKL